MGILVEHITKSYGDQNALDDVSFSIQSGEIVGFLGPNGAGKSTMMKILTGYLTPDSGKAYINNKSIVDEKIAIQRQVGYLPEHNPLYLEMYVREYLHFLTGVHQLSTTNIEPMIETTGLLPEANKKIEQLSKGFRQRVGLAAALLHHPEVLILDEPTTGLDPNQLVEIRELIKKVGETRTIFLSTHIMQEVEAVCDRVLIIDHGQIVADKTMRELRQEHEQVIEVEFDLRIEVEVLRRLSKLKKVVNLGGTLYRLQFDAGDDMRSAVFDFAQENGLKILQMSQKIKNLEDLFHEMTGKKQKASSAHS